MIVHREGYALAAHQAAPEPRRKGAEGRNRRSSRLATSLAAVSLLSAQPTQAQDISAIDGLLKFAGGFSAGAVFYAPTGLIESEVLEVRDALQQIGLLLRNNDYDLSIGADLTSGFTAEEPSLDMRGSIRALPTITRFFETRFGAFNQPMQLNLGLNVGLSQLDGVRSQIRELTPPDRAIELHGNGFHTGAGVGLSTSFGTFGPFIEASARYHTFGSLDWREGGKSFVPPEGWPLTMSLWTGVLRIGIGIAGPAPNDGDDDDDEGEST